MTLEVKDMMKTLEEYEGQHTNFIGNRHEDDESLDKVIHDFLIKEVKKHCRAKLEKFKIPVKISLTTENLNNARFKRMR